MSRLRLLARLACSLLAMTAWPLCAAEIRVAPGAGALERALAAAEDGDVLRLEPGRFEGPVVVERPVTIDGGGVAEIDGRGRGSVVTVAAANVILRGLTILGSGSSHDDIDAGVKLGEKATKARVENNRLLGNLYGVDMHGAVDALVAGNVIEGRRGHRMNERGNGVYVWNAPGGVVEGNDIRWGRDGVFVNTSKRNVFRGNRFRDLRFAVHYMYANDSEVIGNLSIGNHLGYAVMYSKRVRIIDNVSIGDRDHGVMLNYANRSVIEGNLVRDGEDRCVFLYNANKNRIAGNRFERCAIGVHYTAGSADNVITANAFIGSRTQVKYVGTRWLEWSGPEGGNFWSDHPSFDLDGDGFADTPFRPNDSMDHIIWTQPAAKLLTGSPVVQLVRWGQSAFPALLPGGVIDSRPQMRPVRITPPNWSDDDG